MTPSDMQTNRVTYNGKQYFRFVDEFIGTDDKPILDFITTFPDEFADVTVQSSIIKAMIAFNPPIVNTEHIIDKQIGEDTTKVITTQGDVLLGRMSFKMLADDDFDLSKFQLITNENTLKGTEPDTGIKINLDGTYCYEAQSTFRFTQALASKEAKLSNIIVSSGKLDESDPTASTYKTYPLNPTFDSTSETRHYEVELLEYLDTIDITAIPIDEKATIKIKVPQHDSGGNLVYDSDGTTIIYEEKDMTNSVPFEATLNKLGDKETEIKITVTAEDGKTIEEYDLVIKRPYATIKGKGILADFDNQLIVQNFFDNYGVTLNNRVGINIYQAGLADWSTIPDIYQTMTDDPFTYDDLALIPILTSGNSKDDGTFEVYIIPGRYDVQIERPRIP